MPFPFITAEDQAIALKYIADNKIPESRLWINGAVLIIKDAEE
jgi:hypothetical protein